jgi:hypothetical protein
MAWCVLTTVKADVTDSLKTGPRMRQTLTLSYVSEGGGMGRSRFTETGGCAVEQVELVIPVREIARKYGVSDRTVYLWRRKHDGLSPSELKRLDGLKRGNGRLTESPTGESMLPPPGVPAEDLERLSREHSDTEFAKIVQKEKAGTLSFLLPIGYPPLLTLALMLDERRLTLGGRDTSESEAVCSYIQR